MSPDSPSQEEQDAMAAEWAAALAEASSAAPATEVVAEVPEQVSTPSFTNFAPTMAGGPGNDINMILDIPVQLTV